MAQRVMVFKAAGWTWMPVERLPPPVGEVAFMGEPGVRVRCAAHLGEVGYVFGVPWIVYGFEELGRYAAVVALRLAAAIYRKTGSAATPQVQLYSLSPRLAPAGAPPHVAPFSFVPVVP